MKKKTSKAVKRVATVAVAATTVSTLGGEQLVFAEEMEQDSELLAEEDIVVEDTLEAAGSEAPALQAEDAESDAGEEAVPESDAAEEESYFDAGEEEEEEPESDAAAEEEVVYEAESISEVAEAPMMLFSLSQNAGQEVTATVEDITPTAEETTDNRPEEERLDDELNELYSKKGLELTSYQIIRPYWAGQSGSDPNYVIASYKNSSNNTTGLALFYFSSDAQGRISLRQYDANYIQSGAIIIGTSTSNGDGTSNDALRIRMNQSPVTPVSVSDARNVKDEYFSIIFTNSSYEFRVTPQGEGSPVYETRGVVVQYVNSKGEVVASVTAFTNLRVGDSYDVTVEEGTKFAVGEGEKQEGLHCINIDFGLCSGRRCCGTG